MCCVCATVLLWLVVLSEGFAVCNIFSAIHYFALGMLFLALCWFTLILIHAYLPVWFAYADLGMLVFMYLLCSSVLYMMLHISHFSLCIPLLSNMSCVGLDVLFKCRMLMVGLKAVRIGVFLNMLVTFLIRRLLYMNVTHLLYLFFFVWSLASRFCKVYNY